MLFAMPRHAFLAGRLASLTGLPQGHAVVGRFPSGELRATLETPVAGRPCLLLGAVAPPDEDLLGTLLLADTLRKEGARRVTALLPYLAYARQDVEEPGRSLAAAWLGRLLQASGVDAVVTVDVHSRRIHDLFPLPVRSLSPARLFADWVPADDPTVVAPDEGAIERAEALRREAGIRRPIAHFVKRRTAEGVAHTALVGEVSRRAVVVDDILDTGGTLVSACERLQQAGVEDIVVMATHGLFTGSRWRRLWALGVRRIYCTDTVPPPQEVTGQALTVLSSAPLLAAHLGPLAEQPAA